VIDWGDAVVGDPFWKCALRTSRKGDAQSLSVLLTDTTRRVDGRRNRVAHSVVQRTLDARRRSGRSRLGSGVDGLLNAAMRDIAWIR
jgi:hypothetical protein